MIYLYHINLLKAESTLIEGATSLICGSKFLSLLHSSSSEISLKKHLHYSFYIFIEQTLDAFLTFYFKTKIDRVVLSRYSLKIQSEQNCINFIFYWRLRFPK